MNGNSNFIDELLPLKGPPSEATKKQWQGNVPLEVHYQLYNDVTNFLRKLLQAHLKTNDCTVQDSDSLPR